MLYCGLYEYLVDYLIHIPLYHIVGYFLSESEFTGLWNLQDFTFDKFKNVTFLLKIFIFLVIVLIINYLSQKMSQKCPKNVTLFTRALAVLL